MAATIMIAFAGLMGAAGVMLLAASAHMAPGAGVDSAGQVLLFHAAGVLGVIAALHQGLIFRTAGLVVAAGLVLGAALFAADVALRAFVGHRLFPLAAPTGGSILIASWIALSGIALASLFRAS